MALRAATVAELERLRDDGPIHTTGPGVHLVVGAEAASAVLRDEVRFAAVQHLGRLDDDWRDRTLLESTPDVHAPRRRILAAPFAGARLAATGELVDRVVAEQVDAFAPAGKAELVADLARPANGRVLAALLGIADDERDRVFGLALAVLEAENNAPPAIGAHVASAPRAAFAAWAHAHVTARRADPEPPDDALTAFLRPDPATGVTLTDRELVQHLRTFCESAIGFTGRAVASLLHTALTDDHVRAALVAGGAAAAAAVDESLRVDPPVTYALRTCTAPATIAGTEVERGDRVLVSIVGVNRDPDAGGQHVSLGRGPHVCLGAALYRLLAARASRAVLRRLPDVALVDGFVYEDHPWFTGHAPQRLDVRFTPAAGSPGSRPGPRHVPPGAGRLGA